LGGPNAKDGVTENPNAAAVTGFNSGDQTAGFIAGPDPIFKRPTGVFARSPNTGVFGFGDASDSFGVVGNTANGIGTGVFGNTSTGRAGVQGNSLSTGVAVLGTSSGPGAAGRFEGNVEVTGDIVLINKEDLSEDFEITSDQRPDSGAVMVIDSQGRLTECRLPYDKRVAGVIAGHGEFRPAIVLGRQASEQERLPIALVGKVSCKVDASYSPIDIGDLLTTSRTPGHAMRAIDSSRAFGAVIGKALRSLAKGRGHIPILVALQ
jgi:hypothetical protein